LTIASGPEQVAARLCASSIHGRLIRQSIDQANELKDADTADIGTAVTLGAGRYRWFVADHARAHLWTTQPFFLRPVTLWSSNPRWGNTP
jgi:hypothetical protein